MIFLQSTFNFVFLSTFCGCLASIVYFESGTDNICLNFSTSTNATNIRKDNKSICTFFPIANPPSIYYFYPNWNNRTYTCSFYEKWTSVCFDNFQGTDAGLFSSRVSNSDSSSLQNITLKMAVLVELVNLNATSIDVVAGREMTLTCTTSFCIPPANISWYKSALDITKDSTSIRNKNITNDHQQTVSTLVKTVGKSDNGEEIYCTASNIHPKTVKSETLPINILYKPEVVSGTIPKPFRVKEGQDATLICKVTTANPNTDIRWEWIHTEDPANVLHSGPNYTINNIQRGKSGSYNCTAGNRVGMSEPATIIVDVQYKPEVISTPPSNATYSIKENETVKLMCTVDAANPSTNITWKWFMTDSPNTNLHNGPNYTIPNIKRGKSGSYSCTASNDVGTSEAAIVYVDVKYKPEVVSYSPSPVRVEEGKDATLICKVTDANPKTNITWIWINTNSPNIVLHRGPNYPISDIKRNRTGIYNCKANNNVGMSEPATIIVDVLYKPSIELQRSMIVNENGTANISGRIDSNPLSNASWYKGEQLLKNQSLVNTTFLIIERAKCTDTKNYTLVVRNILEVNVTSEVELFVNCKPKPDSKNITRGVTDSTGIEFFATIIAYPQPVYKLKNPDGTNNIKMTKKLTVNAVNNFTICFNQTNIQQDDFGTYQLLLNNSFGNETVFVNILPQRRPDKPRLSNVTCNVKTAQVKWISSFNGGAPQSFTAFALAGQQEASRSELKQDEGENKIHSSSVLNLQPSTEYVFYVSARNRHGTTTSERSICKTLPEESIDNLPLLAGGAAAGGVALAVIVVIVAVVVLRRLKNHEKQVVKSQRLDNDECSNEDTEDGLKENVLYVSAGPREDCKTEGTEYASVTKRSASDNDDTNVYADVKKDGKKSKKEAAIYSDVKPKKGLFKKDGKQKKKNDKKQRSKQEVADVYENSEDIAMTSNADNVYSNTKYTPKTDQEQRGYKNKDGLLYVDVQFDSKKGKENPVIHGEDEKTDYATVEFPMPSSKED